jgi:putative tryptophan/tyrosine transport system substrate-binding protein
MFQTAQPQNAGCVRRGLVAIRPACPAVRPIEQASKFWLVVNPKTAKQLGIAVPPNVLTLADEVIE